MSTCQRAILRYDQMISAPSNFIELAQPNQIHTDLGHLYPNFYVGAGVRSDRMRAMYCVST